MEDFIEYASVLFMSSLCVSIYAVWKSLLVMFLLLPLLGTWLWFAVCSLLAFPTAKK